MSNAAAFPWPKTLPHFTVCGGKFALIGFSAGKKKYVDSADISWKSTWTCGVSATKSGRRAARLDLGREGPVAVEVELEVVRPPARPRLVVLARVRVRDRARRPASPLEPVDVAVAAVGVEAGIDDDDRLREPALRLGVVRRREPVEHRERAFRSARPRCRGRCRRARRRPGDLSRIFFTSSPGASFLGIRELRVPAFELGERARGSPAT